MISLLLLAVFMVKEICGAEEQAVGSGDEDSRPREALISSSSSPVTVPPAIQGWGV